MRRIEMKDAIVEITERARAVVALSTELDQLDERISSECERHAVTISEETRRHGCKMEAYKLQRNALENAISRLGCCNAV